MLSMSRTVLYSIVAAVSALSALSASAHFATDAPAVPTRIFDEGFVGSDACRACHPDNHVSWAASYHRRMTQEPKGDAVLAPFEGTTPAFEGIAWKLSRKDADYIAQPVDPNGRVLTPATRVALTTGSHHYQIYWLDVSGSDELAQMPLVWHVGERRWVPRKSLFLAPNPESQFEETGRWPRACIKCHTTNATQRHGDDGRTRVAEFGIACEACHGPGAAHVELQTERKDLAAEAIAALPIDTTIVSPAGLPHDRSSEVCGQCHAIHPLPSAVREKWEVEGFTYRPGDVLAESRDLLRGTNERNSPSMRALLTRTSVTLADFFWSDGEVRVSGREYNGLVESPCFQRGEMSCLSCHELHPSTRDAGSLGEWADDQLRPGMRGSAACTQCHAEYAEPEKLLAHTHHAAGSSGSNCLNCHMPFTTYGLTKAMRSHTITSPSIAATLATGRPDACNQCHLDKPLGWAADHLHEWYGHDRPQLEGDQEKIAASVLWALSGDAGQRALMAWSFGWKDARAVSGTGWMPPFLSTLLQDPYDAVRFVAMQSVRSDPRHASFALDFTQDIEQQRLAVRSTYLRDWQSTGVSASPAQRAAVLIGPDGKLDSARLLAIYAGVDGRVMQLAE